MNIESAVSEKWKSMLDLIAEITESPGAYVLRTGENTVEFLIKSGGVPGMENAVDKLMADAAVYGEKVIDTRKRLIVSNSLTEDEWKHLPSGLTSYMGYPIFWPAGQVFGALCIIDKKEKKFWNWAQQMLAQYASIMADDLSAQDLKQRLKTQMDSHVHDEAALLQKEDQFRKIFEASPAAILITGLKDNRVIDANDSYLRLFGFTREELVGQTDFQLSIFDDPEIRRVMVKRLNNSEPVRDYETALCTKAGEVKQVLISLDKTIFNDEPCLIYTVYDLSSLIALKQNLQTMNERFSLASRAADMGVWEWNVAGGTFTWDAQMSALYGRNDAAFCGTLADWLAAVHPDDAADAEKRLMSASEDYEDEFRIVRPDGRVRHIKAIGTAVCDEQGNPLRMTGVNIDMTAAKNDQARIAQSEAKYHSLFHSNNAVQMIVDCASGCITDKNRAARDYYGLSGDEEKMLWDIDPSGEKALRKMLAAALEKGTENLSAQHIRFDGQLRDVEIFSGCVEIDSGRQLHMIVQDVTERKNTERGLIESENRFRLFVENAPDGVFVELDGIFVYVNRMAVELFGAANENALLGCPVAAYFPANWQMAPRWRQLAKRPHSMARLSLVRADHKQNEAEISAVPFQLGGEDGTLVFMHDITEHKQLETEKLNMEAQLRHKQKLESIGVLAGGVAHEINNPVSGIINYAQLIAEAPGVGADIVEFSGEIVKEGQRIADIVKNLLKFARQEKQTHSLAQANDIINETLLLIRTIIRTDRIALEVALAPNLPSVKCRSQQIQQVLMNLITNARDALNARYKDEHEDKRILLSSTSFLRTDGTEWVRITVEDYGVGIPDNVKERMFDPFFTTKSRDEGTGLGLSISHGIVSDHHGHLYFESEVNKYTRAILELPVNNGWNLNGAVKE